MASRLARSRPVARLAIAPRMAWTRPPVALARSLVGTIAGTVELHARHVNLFHPVAATLWPSDLTHLARRADSLAVKLTAIDATQTDRFAPAYAEMLKSGPYATGATHAMLVFPEAILLAGLQPHHVTTVATALATPGPVEETLRALGLALEPWTLQPGALPPAPADTHISLAPADGLHFFVCAHGTRDDRCERCGPPLIDFLRRSTQLSPPASPASEVHVWPSSHVGGHRYAANLLVHPAGDWYGYVNDFQDAASIVRHHQSAAEGTMAAEQTTSELRVALRREMQAPKAEDPLALTADDDPSQAEDRPNRRAGGRGARKVLERVEASTTATNEATQVTAAAAAAAGAAAAADVEPVADWLSAEETGVVPLRRPVPTAECSASSFPHWWRGRLGLSRGEQQRLVATATESTEPTRASASTTGAPERV